MKKKLIYLLISFCMLCGCNNHSKSINNASNNITLIEKTNINFTIIENETIKMDNISKYTEITFISLYNVFVNSFPNYEYNNSHQIINEQFFETYSLIYIDFQCNSEELNNGIYFEDIFIIDSYLFFSISVASEYHLEDLGHISFIIIVEKEDIGNTSKAYLDVFQRDTGKKGSIYN